MFGTVVCVSWWAVVGGCQIFIFHGNMSIERFFLIKLKNQDMEHVYIT